MLEAELLLAAAAAAFFVGFFFLDEVLVALLPGDRGVTTGRSCPD